MSLALIRWLWATSWEALIGCLRKGIGTQKPGFQRILTEGPWCCKETVGVVGQGAQGPGGVRPGKGEGRQAGVGQGSAYKDRAT